MGLGMIEQRLVEVETKLAYQEDTLQALNDVICQQQKQIDQLEAACKLLVDRIKALATTNDSSQPADEKPPHY